MFIFHEINQNNLVEALDLVKETFDTSANHYGPEGVDSFYHFIDETNVKKSLSTGDMVLYGAYTNHSLVGVLGIRQSTHICLLFVDKNYHRQGIARDLFNNWKKTLKQPASITVNSSPYAIPVYKKLGFSPIKPAQTIDGITFVPMIAVN